MFNVLDVSEPGYGTLLGSNVPTLGEALYWARYYRHWYGVGTPFPNGEGTYNGIYVVVRQCENTGIYYVLQ